MKASPPPSGQPPAPAEPPAPPVGPTTPAVADKPAVWPEWFHAVDVSAAVLLVVTAFLVGSYAARNADLWLHLAGGRLVAHGQLTPGTDPFSQATNRPWANTTWLFDLGAYALYTSDSSGAALVGVKAAGFAAAFVVLLLLRRFGLPLWPWVVLTGVGLLAAGPYANARPGVASLLFLALTLLLVFRLDWTRPGWRNPLLVGGLFAVWANTDALFVFGPATVGLVLLGGWLNRFLGSEGPTEQAVLPTPPIGPLARGFAVGLAACLLNPFVLAAVARSPGEALVQLVPTELGLTLPPGLDTDRGELELLVLNPFSERYYDQSSRGASLNGAAFGVLAVAGFVVLAVGLPRLTAPHILLYVGFLTLATRHVRLIPYFVVVVVPLVAAHLNGLSARIRAGRSTDQGTRILLTGSGLGRVLTAVVAAVMLLAAYPGLLYPAVLDPLLGPIYPNRVDWAVEPDPGLVRAAKLLDKWRSDGALPADLRGLTTGPDLANYCAWFAPNEKVFVNGRAAFHRADLADLLSIRRGMFGRQGQSTDILAEVAEMYEVIDRLGVGYVTLSRLGVTRRVDDLKGSYFYLLLNDADRWDLWHLDGRAAVLGRTTARTSAVAAFDRLRFDPGRLAFAPDADPVPAGTPLPPPPPPTSDLDRLIQQYADRPKPTPLETDDSVTYATYQEFIRTRDAEREKRRMEAVQFARSAIGGVAISLFTPLDRQTLNDAQYAEHIGLAVLALRAARTGAAKAPDRPDVYLGLAAAYRMPHCPVLEVANPYLQLTEQQIQVLTAQARFVARVPAPADCPKELAEQFVREAWELTLLYERTGQLDLARDTAQRVLDMGKAHPDALRPPIRSGQKPEELIKQAEKQIEDYVDKLSVQVRRGTDAAQRQQTTAAKFQQYVVARLPGKALELFKGVPDTTEFGPAQGQVVLDAIVLELRAGRVEMAAEDLTALSGSLDRYGDRPPPEAAGMVPVVRELQAVIPRLIGDYGAAADLNRVAPPVVQPADVERAITTAPKELIPVIIPWLGVLGGGPAWTEEVGTVLFPAKRLADKEALLSTAFQQFDRGLLALGGGNNVEARKRMDMAGRPQGVELGRLSPVLAERVNRYLRLLKRNVPAAKPAG